MIDSASHDSVSRLVADRPMCLATALDKAFEKIDRMSAIFCCQANKRINALSNRVEYHEYYENHDINPRTG
jgi:hypothetical protein